MNGQIKTCSSISCFLPQLNLWSSFSWKGTGEFYASFSQAALVYVYLDIFQEKS